MAKPSACLPFLFRTVYLGVSTACALTAQEWSDDDLVQASAGFQQPALTAQFEQVGQLLSVQRDAYTAMLARIHGDHREYRLKIDRLLQELADPSWQVREHAERTLVEIGARAWGMIQQRRDEFEVLEQQIRCARVLDALAAKGRDEEQRELNLLRGLVRTSLYVNADERLQRALRSALGHTDSSIAGGALLALGTHGRDDDVPAIAQMLAFKGGLHRSTALAALGRLRTPGALALVRRMLLEAPPAELGGVSLNRGETMLLLRSIRARDDEEARELLAALRSHPDELVAEAAALELPSEGEAASATLLLPDRTTATGGILTMTGDTLVVAAAFPMMERAELTLSDCSSFDFANEPTPTTSARVFLQQGSLLCGELIGCDPESVRLRSPTFGDLTLPRSAVQGVATDPSLDRLVGASTERERVRLRSGEFLDGRIVSVTNGQVTVEPADGAARQVPVGDVQGLLFLRPRTTDPDNLSYARVDLVTGERLIGFVAGATPTHLALAVPLAGAAAVPWQGVRHVELAVTGGAMWGFTLIADYSDNRIVEIDDQGREVFELIDVFGAWDAECLDNDNILVTAFSVSQVSEVNRKGETVWSYEDLKNPYDADRLPNGNTLIADTFGSRVIEVNRAGEVVWSYAEGIRPFDVDRLPNGNTLIADGQKDRIIEVSPSGEIVWEAKDMPAAHDADRLPNGNTLVTLRNKTCVVEIDRDGKVVFELQGLQSPSDADRLPNGNTLVAESNFVREFDRHGNEVWRVKMNWAVEVNRY